MGTIGAGAPAASVSAPLVGGAAQVGSPLTCAGDTWSSWAGLQPLRGLFGFDGYGWLRDGAPLAEATPTYTPAAEDLGHQISCEVTVTYPLLDVTTSAASTPVLIGPAPAPGAPGAPGAIGAGAPVIGQAPPTSPRRPTVLRRARIVGVARVGRTLRCGGARVRGASTLAFTWRRGGRAIPGARRSRYTVRGVDRGRLLACAVRATGAGGAVATVSAAVRVRP